MSEELDSEDEQWIVAQMRRNEAYREGEYELSDGEGFFCTECSWRGLSAPMNTDSTPHEMAHEDVPICICPECGAPAETSDEPTETFLEPFLPDDTS